MSDGSSLRQSWYKALDDAEARFRQLLTSSPAQWRRVTASQDASTSRKGKGRAFVPELSDVVVHKHAGNAGGDDIYRLVLDTPSGETPVSLEPFKSVLSTPEIRQEWDPAVTEAHMVEMIDRVCRVTKTNFSLGWPANPRDTVTISRSRHDPSTVIDISTSLPRSADEPVYLRPAPPYVRSNVTLFAWCIQYIPASDSSKKPTFNFSGGRTRITCFWQHDLRSIWNLTSASSMVQQLSMMVLGLFKSVLKRGQRVAKLTGFGNGVNIERSRYQIDREALTLDYSIIPEEEAPSDLESLREHRRLTRSVEFVLPASQGWDVQVTTKASSEAIQNLPWATHVVQSSSYHSGGPQDQLILRLVHSPLLNDHSILKARAVIEISGPSTGLRMNGVPQIVQEVEDRDPSTYANLDVLPDISGASVQTGDSLKTMSTHSSTSSSNTVMHAMSERTAGAEKSILSRVKRNYIYFSSLLQEPEAKWKRSTEFRGVTVTQLDSIDPTLVVYRAEATFVGVGLWDLFGAVVSPGARNFWDRQHEDAFLLEDVNELTELWHFKTKPAWPAVGRDSVVLKTVYKSPTTIHVFAFSADDPHLFPNVPPSEPNVIRTQIDIQGWAIEALSPTTTQLTLLEQSDPKGWTNKTSIPTLMINNVAGIGEFAIKHGGPPVITRLSGAKVNDLRYDHEKMSFKAEYVPAATRMNDGGEEAETGSNPKLSSPVIECELRCDLDTWAASLDIVIDPPPQTISCLRRHRLASEGGGLWLTIGHEGLFLDDERMLLIVRKGPGKEKGVVMVNGAKVPVDNEELPEKEIKELTKRKRIKPIRVPLDQPPVVSAIRKRREEWSDGNTTNASDTDKASDISGSPKTSSPLARFWSMAINQTTTSAQQAVAAISPAVASVSGAEPLPSVSKPPAQHVLDTLAWVQDLYTEGIGGDSWVAVGQKGLPVHRKLFPQISPVIPVHKAEKVIEGISAEELVSIVTEDHHCKKWDTRVDSMTVLQSFGSALKTSFVVTKTGFPFRDRGFYLASVQARSHASDSKHAVFCVSVSFNSDFVASFGPTKYNPYALPIGKVFVDAWIMETLDPYSKENYAIPSSKCTRLVAVDYAGSIPAAYNSTINSTLPRSILGVETYFRSTSASPITRLPVPELVITEKKDVDPFGSGSISWKLRDKDEDRKLLHTSYAVDEQVYRSVLLVNVPPGKFSNPNSSAVSNELTPRPSRNPTDSSSSNEIDQEADDEKQRNEMSRPTLPSSTSTDSAQSLRHVASSPSLTPQNSTLQASGSTFVGRGRSASAFTARGQVKPITDLLLGEVVVDVRLYPTGYSLKAEGCIVPHGSPVLLDSLFHEDKSDTGVASGKKQDFPFRYTVHTMPSSPTHSSGMNSATPTRQLIRITLPTAQYQISTVHDPLTGEVQHAPETPQWLKDMETGKTIVKIEIRSRERSEKGNEVVFVDIGADKIEEVAVVSEKDALTTLGREALLDERVSKMTVLTRSLNGEGEAMPDTLKDPIAVADRLLDATPFIPPPASDNKAPESHEESTSSESGGEILEKIQSDEGSSSKPTPKIHRSSSGGLLGFFQSYQNPLTRLTSPSPPVRPASISRQPSSSSGILPPGGLIAVDAASSPASVEANSAGVRTASGGLPLSMIIIIALIAFLMGSLLRSLISPADFVYVVTDLADAEDARSVKGWREMRRLFEIKYLFGGWDFQIAAVRRHQL